MKPQQLDGTECGPFVILYGLLRLNGWSSERIHNEVKMDHAKKMRQQLRQWCTTSEKEKKLTQETLLRQKRKAKRLKDEQESSESSQEPLMKKKRKD
jgi:hypothetical protein